MGLNWGWLPCCLMINLVLGGEAPLAEPPQDFTRLLKQLEDERYQVRQEARERMLTLPSSALQEVETALRKTGLDSELKSNLEAVRVILQRKVKREMFQAKEAAWLNWNARTVRQAYDEVGTKDPKWDESARQALDGLVQIWGGTNKGRANALRVYGLLEHAIKAGCKDPLILYAKARLHDTTVRKDFAGNARLFNEAAQLMERSRYHPLRKAVCFARATTMLGYSANMSKRAFTENQAKAVEMGETLALEQFELLASEKDLPERALIDCAITMLDMFKECRKDRSLGYGRIQTILDKTHWGEVVKLKLKGKYFKDFAWDARGGDWANTVTEEGWKLFRERLTFAEESYEKAWALDPTDPEIATEMLGVELGQSKGRERMELWFQRAMEANPDNLAACEKKLNYLEPKWHGSAEEMLAFGRQLVKEGNWEAELPFVLMTAHKSIVQYENDPKAREAYWKRPEVWQDIKSLFEGTLKFKADNHAVRSHYCSWACNCSQRDEAKRLFTELGDQIDPTPFGGKEKLQVMRAKALQAP